MRKGYTAVIKKTTDWWIGWIEEVPGVNCQEPTREALLETLKVTLQERSAVPRHTEIDDRLALKICKDLGTAAIGRCPRRSVADGLSI